MGTLLCLICIAVANFVVLGQPSAAQRANTTLLLTYPGQILQADGSQTCHSEGQRKRVRNEVDSAMLSLLRETVVPLLQQNFSCGGSFGWRRVAYLDMSDPSQSCPYVWKEITTPHRVCGRRSTSSSGSCEEIIYTTGSAQYNQVCGRITGYQLGNTDTFLGSRLSIDTNYVDGVSVTHGTPRQHVWTFSNGLDELSTSNPYATCPCVTGSTNGPRIP